MIKVRFHLLRGKYFRHWQVTEANGNKLYFDPYKINLNMWFCTLFNKRSIAEKIWKGENKTVCSWVECSEWSVSNKIPNLADYENLKYNPRILPYWTDESGNDIDGQHVDYLTTFENKIYKIKFNSDYCVNM